MAENKSQIDKQQQLKEVLEFFEEMVTFVEKERPVAWKTLLTQVEVEMKAVLTPIMANAILSDRASLIKAIWQMFLPAILNGNLHYATEAKAMVTFAENCVLAQEGHLPEGVDLDALRAATRAFFEFIISEIGTAPPFVDAAGAPVPERVAQAATIRNLLTTIYKEFQDDHVFDKICTYFAFFFLPCFLLHNNQLKLNKKMIDQMIGVTYFLLAGYFTVQGIAMFVELEPFDEEVALRRSKRGENIIVKTTKTVSVPPESNPPKQHHHRHDLAVDSGTTSDSS